MDEKALLGALRAGIDRTRDFMAELTDYHGGPVATEYLLVGDIDRPPPGGPFGLLVH